MAGFSTPAVVLRRVEYGDNDLILTLFSMQKGKIAVIAKSARRSTKRFSGALELFALSDAVCSTGRRKGLLILKEAALKRPFDRIRVDIQKTAYASYWSELLHIWLEEGQPQAPLFTLFETVLRLLDSGSISADVLSVVFQMRFLSIAGLCPNLSQCCDCRREVAQAGTYTLNFNLAKGGLVCEACHPGSRSENCLSKGAIKELQWIESRDLRTAVRIRFGRQTLAECLAFLEAFVPFHVGKVPRSLNFLRQIRQGMPVRPAP